MVKHTTFFLQEYTWLMIIDSSCSLYCGDCFQSAILSNMRDYNVRLVHSVIEEPLLTNHEITGFIRCY